ncbi:MAG TPA: thioredoxin domain-containing protein [Geminicoccaceae bacterium]|nr:thioredoxin domain-containing protein [Geminicoccus sp.]HMU49851.1 thioredoxin domain-containing protein [Geminicoccaceae bacterium]
MANRLAGATSPYLLQHEDNPVDWHPWGGEALAEARSRDVPILLSIGYAACHWCHVMAHESFENERIAAQMNAGFVNIKVDREERPDIDTIYMQALHLLGQQGGWPLTMFLTPDGEPFWGGTYFPPEPRWGRAGLPQVLDQISRLWRHERHKIEGNRAALGEAMRRLASASPGELPEPALAQAVGRGLAKELDPVNGGLGGAPKFPQAPAIDLIWQTALATGDDRLRRRVEHGLARMCQGGIYDHLGGGLARYSVDERWLVPHFEKMLYDNAQLLRLLGEAWAIDGDPLFQARAVETVDWLRREMMVEDGFASSLDADSEGEEGRFYVWSAEEIDRKLGADAALFGRAYDVEPGGNWEGRTILNRLHEPGLAGAEEEAVLARCRARLLEVRSRRPRPGRDDKVLADWNGLMIAALADAAWRFGRPDWLAMAERAFAWIVAHLSEGDRLHHSWRDGRRLPQAFLDDYAAMALAAMRLFELTAAPAHLDHARAWLAVLDRHYADPAGGYFSVADDADDLVVRPKTGQDGPTPSGNALALQALARLAAITGETGHERAAEGILCAFAGEIRRMPSAFAGLLGGVALLAEPVQLVIVGDRGSRELLDAAASAQVTSLVLGRIGEGEALPAGHPAAGKAMVEGRATAYICVGRSCLPPIISAERLRRELAGIGGRTSGKEGA